MSITSYADIPDLSAWDVMRGDEGGGCYATPDCSGSPINFARTPGGVDVGAGLRSYADVAGRGRNLVNGAAQSTFVYWHPESDQHYRSAPNTTHVYAQGALTSLAPLPPCTLFVVGRRTAFSGGIAAAVGNSGVANACFVTLHDVYHRLRVFVPSSNLYFTPSGTANKDSMDAAVVRIGTSGANTVVRVNFLGDATTYQQSVATGTGGAPYGTIATGGPGRFHAGGYAPRELTDAEVSDLLDYLSLRLMTSTVNIIVPAAMGSAAWRVTDPTGRVYTGAGSARTQRLNTSASVTVRSYGWVSASATVSLTPGEGADYPVTAQAAGTTAASAALALAVPGISITPQGSGRPLVTVSRVDHGGTVRAVTLSELWDYCHAWMSADAARYPLAPGAYDGYTLSLDCDLHLTGGIALHGAANQQVSITGTLTQADAESICTVPVIYSGGTLRTSVLRLTDVAAAVADPAAGGNPVRVDIVVRDTGGAVVMTAGGSCTSDAAWALPASYAGYEVTVYVSPPGRASVRRVETVAGQLVVLSALTQYSVDTFAVQLAAAAPQLPGITPAAGSLYAGSGGGATPAEIWAYASRTLTSPSGLTPAEHDHLMAIPTDPAMPADVVAARDDVIAAMPPDPDNARIAAIDARLPASPAAVGSAMTLAPEYDAAKTAASQASVDALGSPMQESAYTAPPTVTQISDRLERTGGMLDTIPTLPEIQAVLPAEPDNAGIAAARSASEAVNARLPESPSAIGDPMSLASAPAATLTAIERMLRNKFVTYPADHPDQSLAGRAVLFADDGVTVLYSAVIYEDAAGTTLYRGQGIESRGRFE